MDKRINNILARLAALVLAAVCVALFFGSLLSDTKEVAANRKTVVDALLKEARR